MHREGLGTQIDSLTTSANMISERLAEKIYGLSTLMCSLRRRIRHFDSDNLIRTTCTSPRHEFYLDLGKALRDQPLPGNVTESTGGKPLEDPLFWASDITSTECNEDLPSTDGIYKVDKNELILACPFYSTFTPSIHRSEETDGDGILQAMLWSNTLPFTA